MTKEERKEIYKKLDKEDLVNLLIDAEERLASCNNTSYPFNIPNGGGGYQEWQGPFRWVVTCNGL